MIRKGDILYNPLSRETITFLQTAADTAGLLLQIEVNWAPERNHCYTKAHVHPKQKETLFIKSGKVWVTMEGIKSLHKPGDTIQIPAGVPHKLENASKEEELNFLCEMAPALCTERLYETILALSQSDKRKRGWTIPLLQYALTLNKHKNHIYTTAFPLWFQKVLFTLLSPLALLMGYKAEMDYKKVLSEKKVLFSSLQEMPNPPGCQ